MNFRWPQMVPTPLKNLIPSANQDGLTIMRDMMLWDPSKRPSAAQVRYKSTKFNARVTVDVTISFFSQILRHNYFKVGQNLSASRAPPAQSRQPLITPQRHGSHQQPAHVPSLPARDLSPFKFDHNKPAPAPAMQHLHKPPAQKAALTPKVYQSFKLQTVLALKF